MGCSDNTPDKATTFVRGHPATSILPLGRQTNPARSETSVSLQPFIY
jgi:hypothetical protein